MPAAARRSIERKVGGRSVGAISFPSAEDFLKSDHLHSTSCSRSACNRSLHLVLEDADMAIVIGPVLRCADGYSFDTWTAGNGVSPGYPYRRIEDAHYARNTTIKATAQGRAVLAIVCQTVDEFIARSDGYEMLAAA
jgi:hypothetical protein